MSALRVSLVQEPLVWHDPPANRARFSALLTPLAQRTDLIVPPETFTSGFSMRSSAWPSAPADRR
jgi:predicted amidohydrolase